LDWWTLLLATVFVLWGIGLPLLGLRVFAGVDLLGAWAPWSAAHPTGFVPHLPCTGDTIDSAIPTAAEFHDRLWGGDFASWDPYGTGGVPLASVPNSALTSPLSLPFLLLPTWLAPAFVKLFELAVTIGGMVLFLRRVGVGRAGATLAGVVFASSGYMVLWTNWPQTRTAAFIPALFWAVERLVQRRRAADVALIAGVVACLLLGGFPAITGYALYAAVPYLLVRLWVENRRPGRVVGGATLAGVGLAGGLALVAIQLLPFFSQLGQMDVEARDQPSWYHLPAFTLVTAFAPDGLGNCVNGASYGPANPIEVIAFVGVTAALLGLVGLVARRGPAIRAGVRTYLALALVAVLALGWLGGPLLAGVQHLPVFSNNYVGRIRVLLGFLVACLAGLGYDALVRGRADGPASRWRRTAAVGICAAAGLGLADVLVQTLRYLGGRGRVDDFIDASRLPAVVGVLAVALVGLAWFRWRPGRQVALTVLPVLVLVESLAFVLPFWPRVPRSEFYPQTPAHSYLADHLGGDRFGSEGVVLYPATGAAYGLRAVTGHAFTAPTWADLLVRIDPRTFLTSTFSAFPGPDSPTIVRSPILDRLSVRYFAFAAGALPLGRQETVGSPAGQLTLTDGVPVEVRMPARALRGAGPVLAAAMVRPPDRFARLDLQILRPDGSVLASSSRRFGNGWRAAPFLVAVPGEDAASAAGGTVRVRLTLHAAGTSLKVAATSSGAPVLSVVTGRDDGLRLVFADAGAVLYQRTTSLPRIRWASMAIVEPDRDARLGRLAAGVPPDTVLLDEAAPAASGRPAAVEVLEDSGDRMRVRVRAQGAGYLVVADALQTDWSVSMDGRQTTLRRADHALVAVAVSAGTHEVALTYTPARRPLGAVVTALAIAVLAGLLVAERIRRPRHHDGVHVRDPDLEWGRRAVVDGETQGSVPSGRTGAGETTQPAERAPAEP